MFLLKPSLLQRIQHLLLFSIFILGLSASPLPESPLSAPVSIGLFMVMDVVLTLLNRRLERQGMSGLGAFLMTQSAVLILFLAISVLSALSAGLAFPSDLLALRLHSYLILVLPAVVTACVLRYVSLRSRGGHWLVLMINLTLMSLLLSRRGWSLHLPLDNLIMGFTFLYLFLFLQILLFLSAGQRGRRMGLAPLLLMMLIPLIVLLPLSRLYREESIKEGGGLLESSLFRFDFSDYLSLESSISMKDELVFLMKVDKPGEDLLTRRFILSAYDRDRGFHRERGEIPETPRTIHHNYLLDEQPLNWESPLFEQTRIREQEYYFVNFDSSAFLGLNSPVSATPFLNWEGSSFSRVYRVESRVSTAWGWDLLSDSALEPDTPEASAFLEYYSRGELSEELRELALNISQGKTQYYDRVDAIRLYLQDNYFYSLNPGESETGDQLSHFLFESRKGYCSYFAFSMALLCRSLGIPARVALGFQVDGRSRIMNYYPVRANQAHAWVEVYFPRYGWINFDPTSRTPAPGEDFTLTDFSPQEMEPYLTEILENRASLRIPPPGEDSAPRPPQGGGLWYKGRYFLLPTLALLFCLTVLVCVRLLWLYRLFSPGSHRRWAAPYFFAHMYIVYCLMEVRREEESVQDYAGRLGESLPELYPLVSRYEKIRFGLSSQNDLHLLYREGKELRNTLFASSSGRKASVRVLFRLLLPGWERSGRRTH